MGVRHMLRELATACRCVASSCSEVEGVQLPDFHMYILLTEQIIDHFFLPEVTSRPLKDEVMKIMPVQKQTRAGQRTRFKAFVAIGDGNGHCGLGVKCAKEVASAIRGAIIAAKLSLIPVRYGNLTSASRRNPHVSLPK